MLTRQKLHKMTEKNEVSNSNPVYESYDRIKERRTARYEQMQPLYEQVPNSSKMSELDNFITMILKTGKEFHAGATYQTQDFAAVCIDESGGVVSLDFHDVTLLLPPLSLCKPCATIYLYMENVVCKRVHGNPTYASPVVRVGCISDFTPSLFQESAVLSLPLYAGNQIILPFYQENYTDPWNELIPEHHACLKDGSRCTISIDKAGIYTCLNYSNDITTVEDPRRVVLPIQCEAYAKQHTSDALIQMIFCLSSKDELGEKKESIVEPRCVDGSRQLLLDVSETSPSKTLIIDVIGIHEGWVVYGEKQQFKHLSTIRKELNRFKDRFTVNFYFNRIENYDIELACKLRIYMKDIKGNGTKEKLSLFRYNCARKTVSSDEKHRNRLQCKQRANNAREVLDLIDRCLAHITKIISSNLNGIWEKRFAESMNIPKMYVESAQEISVISKALYIFVGSRFFSMNDNEIVLEFITAANAVAKEIKRETEKHRRSRAKALSLPHGAGLRNYQAYKRHYSTDTTASASMSKFVSPRSIPSRRQTMYSCNSENTISEWCNETSSLESLPSLNEGNPETNTTPVLIKQRALDDIPKEQLDVSSPPAFSDLSGSPILHEGEYYSSSC